MYCSSFVSVLIDSCPQHYYQYKKNLAIWTTEENQEFPWQIEHLVKDTIAAVRPKLQLVTSLEEAQKAVQSLNSQIVSKAIEVISCSSLSFTFVNSSIYL